MEVLKKLPLPEELVVEIASYDRVLSVKKIPRTDERYEILRENIAPRDYEIIDAHEWDCVVDFKNINFIFHIISSSRSHKLYYNFYNTNVSRYSRTEIEYI